jgi:hypothetical protein
MPSWVVSSSSYSNRRRDDVERRIVVRQLLCVGDLERDVDPSLVRLALRRLDEGWREVGRSHVGAGAAAMNASSPVHSRCRATDRRG